MRNNIMASLSVKTLHPRSQASYNAPPCEALMCSRLYFPASVLRLQYVGISLVLPNFMREIISYDTTGSEINNLDPASWQEVA